MFENLKGSHVRNLLGFRKTNLHLRPNPEMNRQFQVAIYHVILQCENYAWSPPDAKGNRHCGSTKRHSIRRNDIQLVSTRIHYDSTERYYDLTGRYYDSTKRIMYQSIPSLTIPPPPLRQLFLMGRIPHPPAKKEFKANTLRAYKNELKSHPGAFSKIIHNKIMKNETEIM